MNKQESLNAKNEAIAKLQAMLTPETIVYTYIVKATNNGNFLVASYICKDNEIVRISHLVARAFGLRLNKDLEFYTGVCGTGPAFHVAYLLGGIVRGANRHLPYQVL